jgi:alpha-tubulin suppressor-like RCC1 family protein
MIPAQNLKLICLLGTLLLQSFHCVAQPITKIAGGFDHSLFLKSDGSLWGMGSDDSGQLGDGTAGFGNHFLIPQAVTVSNVTAIAAGAEHSLFLMSNGSLWGMGSDDSGQLGGGTSGPTVQFPLPEIIVASNVTAIAAGSGFSLFLKNDGSLWAMGQNWCGQLGDGTTSDALEPEQIVASNVTAVAAGQYHSLFLQRDGSLWGMGYNQFGQLGDGTYNDAHLPEQIVASNVTAIAAGYDHSLFIKSSGSLWSVGENFCGQLGIGTFSTEYPYGTNNPQEIIASNVTQIAAASGSLHSLFLKSDGSMWAMGYNGSGQLGDGTFNSCAAPENIEACGVTAIVSENKDSLLLKSDGSLWGMGQNEFGELGNGTTNQTAQPEQILAAYNRIIAQLVSTGDMQFSFVGVAGANYALDRSFSLSPAIWMPQTTNPANSYGELLFTNTLDSTTNNFWRIRAVP